MRNEYNRFAELGYGNKLEDYPDEINFNPCAECSRSREYCKCMAWKAWFAYRWRRATKTIKDYAKGA